MNTYTTVTHTPTRLEWRAVGQRIVTDGFFLAPSRIGFDWELWRDTPGVGPEALGTGTVAELQARATDMAGWTRPHTPVRRRAMAAESAPLPTPTARKTQWRRLASNLGF